MIFRRKDKLIFVLKSNYASKLHNNIVSIYLPIVCQIKISIRVKDN